MKWNQPKMVELESVRNLNPNPNPFSAYIPCKSDCQQVRGVLNYAEIRIHFNFFPIFNICMLNLWKKMKEFF